MKFRSNLVGEDPKAFQCIRAEGRDDGAIGGIPASRYQDASDARHVVA